jgi:hypothetical protein
MATGVPAWVPFPPMKRPFPHLTAPNPYRHRRFTLDFGRNGRRIHRSDTLRGKAFRPAYFIDIFYRFFQVLCGQGIPS